MDLDNNQFNIFIMKTFYEEKYNKLINITMNYTQIYDAYPSTNKQTILIKLLSLIF